MTLSTLRKSLPLILLSTLICGSVGCQSLLADALEAPIPPKTRVLGPYTRFLFLPSQSSQITWTVVSGPPAAASFDSDGTVTMIGPEEVIVRSNETVSSDFFFEITVPPRFGADQSLPYIGLDSYPLTPTGTKLWGINSLGNQIRVDSQSKL